MGTWALVTLLITFTRFGFGAPEPKPPTDPHLASLCAAFLSGRAEAGRRLGPREAEDALDGPLATLLRHPAARNPKPIWSRIRRALGVVDADLFDVHLQLESEPFPSVDPGRERDVRISLLQLERLRADLHQWSDPITPLRHELRGKNAIAAYLAGRIEAARASHLGLLKAQAERTALFDVHLLTLEDDRLRDLAGWRDRRESGSKRDRWFGPDSILRPGERLGVLAGYATLALGFTSALNAWVPGAVPFASVAFFSGGWFAVRQHLYSAVERLKIGWRAYFQREEDFYHLDRLRDFETAGARATEQIRNMQSMIEFMDRARDPDAMAYHSFSADLPVVGKRKFGRDPEIQGEQILEGLVLDETPFADGRLVQLHHVLRFDGDEPVLLTFLLERKNTAAADLYMTMGFF